MKKFLFLLMLLPSLALAENLHTGVANSYGWGDTVASSNDVAWQVFNSTTNNTVNKKMFIQWADLSTTEGGYFVVYSTDVWNGSGFTGIKTLKTLYPVSATDGGTALTSATISDDATLPTGDVLWSGIVNASDTYHLKGPFLINPGKSIYILKTNGAANEKATVSFRIKETY